MADEIDRNVLNLAVLTYLSKRIKGESDSLRGHLGEQLSKGTTLPARSPIDDSRIARISLSDPKPRAVVTDRAAVERWVTENYPEKLCERTEITGPMAEVLAVLREHAPHLITDRKSVPDWAVNELVVRSEKYGTPVGYGGEAYEHAPPGISVSIPDGALKVVLDPTAEDSIRALWEAGRVGMDGVKLIEGES